MQRVLLVVPTEALEQGPGYAEQTEDERIAAIREQLDSWWVGPIAETIIEDIWRSFGSELPAVAAKHPNEWLDSIERGAEIADLPAFTTLRRKFEFDVRSTALLYMASNRELVDRDRERLGLTEQETTTRFGAMAREAATAELQQIALEGADVVAAETALKQIHVGYTESDDMEGFTFRTYVQFDPAHPPGPHVVVEDPSRLKAANENWKRLQEVRAQIGRRIDELHAQLVEAAKRGDSGEVARLCDEVADRQAMINVSEGGGYFTGGGTRRYVSERDRIPGMAAGEASPAQLYGAYLAQLPSLDKAADGLRKALAGKGGPGGLENAMRALGKYGERQNEVAAALVRRPLPYGPSALDDIVASWFDEVAAECQVLLHEVRSGGVRTALGQVEAARALRARAGDLLDRMQRLSANLRETLLEHSRAAGVLADAGPMTAAIRHELLVEQLAAFARFGFRILQEEAEQQVKEQATAPAETPKEPTPSPAPAPSGGP